MAKTVVVVKAYFPTSPSENHKEYVEKSLVSLILEADKSVSWEVYKKDGSWEISIIVWCGEKLAEWLFGESLNGLVGATKSKILQWREVESSCSVQNDSSLSSSKLLHNLSSGSVDSSLPLPSEESVHVLCRKANALIEELGAGGEKIQLTFASYSDVHGGRVFTASKDGGSKEFSLIATDSQEDFDLRTGFDLKQRRMVDERYNHNPEK
jgi:hypothetical protein